MVLQRKRLGRKHPRSTPGTYANETHGHGGTDVPALISGSQPPPIKVTDLPAEIVLPRLRHVQGVGPEWQACCPAHADSRPSLSVKECDEGRLLVYCHAGCETGEVMEAIGLNMGHLFPSPFALHHATMIGKPRVISGVKAASGSVTEPDVDHAAFAALHKSCLQGAERHQQRLAKQLGVPVESIRALGIGFRKYPAFPERDGQGRVIGIIYRHENGDRVSEKGGARGLTIPAKWSQRPGPIYLAEGATDTSALRIIHYRTVPISKFITKLKLLDQVLFHTTSAK